MERVHFSHFFFLFFFFLLKKVVDPVARQGIVQLYTTGGGSFVDKHFKRDAATSNSLMAQVVRKKLSTTSMLAGEKWDNPNVEITQDAIKHYLETYHPRMDEILGVTDGHDVSCVVCFC